MAMSIISILFQLEREPKLIRKTCVNTFSLRVLTGDDVLGLLL